MVLITKPLYCVEESTMCWLLQSKPVARADRHVRRDAVSHKRRSMPNMVADSRRELPRIRAMFRRSSTVLRISCCPHRLSTIQILPRLLARTSLTWCAEFQTKTRRRRRRKRRSRTRRAPQSASFADSAKPSATETCRVAASASRQRWNASTCLSQRREVSVPAMSRSSRIE